MVWSRQCQGVWSITDTLNEIDHRLGHRGNPQPLPNERGDLVRWQRIET